MLDGLNSEKGVVNRLAYKGHVQQLRIDGFNAGGLTKQLIGRSQG